LLPPVTLALLADLRGEERDAHVIRLDAAGDVGEARGFVGAIFQERFLRSRQQLVHHPLYADARARIVTLES
jgi:hypothetical protein